jgi:soluble lytic murein transglycosylase-like protein
LATIGHRRTWRFWALTACTTITLAAGLPAAAFAQDGATASLPGDDVQVDGVNLPKPLDAVNADRYRDIFRLQAAGDFRRADEIISELTDQSLLGHVLADRYLSKDYTSNAKELGDWLKRFSTLAVSQRIYLLALDKGAQSPTQPVVLGAAMGSPDEGYNDRDANWLAGLEAWKRGNFAQAAAAFTRDAENAENDPWDASKAAFWVARSYLRAKQPDKVSPWLKQAAKHPLTFYGQLATRALGIEPQIDWTAPKFTRVHGEQIMNARSGKRAMALLQVGQNAMAEKELLLLEQKAKDSLDEALLAVSQAAKLPTLALKLGATQRLYADSVIPAALYPVPEWAPEGGFTVDRALLYAVMRQESGFNPTAISGMGAIGLMQIMPDTGKRLGFEPAQLRDPEVSMAAGQKYLGQLLEMDLVESDVLMAAAAYNAGPGSLQKWKKASRAGDDALMFLETLPAKETRQFVKRVLAAYWIYQERLGQDTPTLKALATGGWPRYMPQDEVATASN